MGTFEPEGELAHPVQNGGSFPDLTKLSLSLLTICTVMHLVTWNGSPQASEAPT